MTLQITDAYYYCFAHDKSVGTEFENESIITLQSGRLGVSLGIVQRVKKTY